LLQPHLGLAQLIGQLAQVELGQQLTGGYHTGSCNIQRFEMPILGE
jgi:hypothetical protein